MNSKQVIKSTQEQAVAAWVGYLNQIKIDKLFTALSQQDSNLKKAMETIGKTKEEIAKLIATNRGGSKGLHGYIAEIAEVGVGNARRNIEGKNNIYKWLNDNGISDLKRYGSEIQVKFVASKGPFSLGAVKEHLAKYPDYLKNGEVYHIPKDHYEAIHTLYKMSEKEAYKTLSNNGNGLTVRQWRSVHEFFDNNPDITIKDIKPSLLEYDEVQVGTIDKTIKKEKQSLKETDKQRREAVKDDNKPSLEDAGKATVTAAVTEGAMTFVICIVNKIKSGKSLTDFTEDDWKEILKETGISTAKGGVRGANIYSATSAITVNAPMFYDVGIAQKALDAYNRTAAVSANAIVTASFGFAGLINKYRKHEINEIKLLEDSQIVCLDAAVSALSSLVGQMIIPVPWIGAIVGNVVGTMMYKISKENFNAKEQKIIKQYYEEMKALEEKLGEKYRQFASDIDSAFESFIFIVENAFAVDLDTAFKGSVELAKMCDVPDDEILDTLEKGKSYFLD